ncbi:hypothetical protein FRB99_000518 [Tulasnella sp. 403]|nr:hypothetical protein FRB99_000518 [Tulasnella sp. 403]
MHGLPAENKLDDTGMAYARDRRTGQGTGDFKAEVPYWAFFEYDTGFNVSQAKAIATYVNNSSFDPDLLDHDPTAEWNMIDATKGKSSSTSAAISTLPYATQAIPPATHAVESASRSELLGPTASSVSVPSSFTPKLLIGVVVGGLGVLAACTFTLIFCVVRRRKTRRSRPISLLASEHGSSPAFQYQNAALVTPFPPSSSMDSVALLDDAVSDVNSAPAMFKRNSSSHGHSRSMSSAALSSTFSATTTEHLAPQAARLKTQIQHGHLSLEERVGLMMQQQQYILQHIYSQRESSGYDPRLAQEVVGGTRLSRHHEETNELDSPPEYVK